jgi:hypothetical protein
MDPPEWLRTASVVHSCKCVDSAGPEWTVAKVGADTQRYVAKFYNYKTARFQTVRYTTVSYKMVC